MCVGVWVDVCGYSARDSPRVRWSLGVTLVWVANCQLKLKRSIWTTTTTVTVLFSGTRLFCQAINMFIYVSIRLLVFVGDIELLSHLSCGPFKCNICGLRLGGCLRSESPDMVGLATTPLRSIITYYYAALGNYSSSSYNAPQRQSLLFTPRDNTRILMDRH